MRQPGQVVSHRVDTARDADTEGAQQTQRAQEQLTQRRVDLERESRLQIVRDSRRARGFAATDEDDVAFGMRGRGTALRLAPPAQCGILTHTSTPWSETPPLAATTPSCCGHRPLRICSGVVERQTCIVVIAVLIAEVTVERLLQRVIRLCHNSSSAHRRVLSSCAACAPMCRGRTPAPQRTHRRQPCPATLGSPAPGARPARPAQPCRGHALARRRSRDRAHARHSCVPGGCENLPRANAHTTCAGPCPQWA